MSEHTSAGQSAQRERLRSEFESLPLDRKLCSLVELEVVALNETVKYVFNSPMDAVKSVANAISIIGDRLEEEFRKAANNPRGTATAEPSAGDDGKKKRTSKSAPVRDPNV